MAESRSGGTVRPPAARQPPSHRLAWQLTESGIRGNTHIGARIRRGQRTLGLVELPDGLALILDPADWVSNAIYRGGYEPGERSIVRQLVRSGGTVVDVGAHVGLYTLTAAVLVGPQGHVVAVEPGPALRDLRAAVDATGHGNVTIVPHAVGAEDGEAVLHVPAQGAFLASLRTSVEKGDPHVVSVKRLDGLDGVPDGQIDLLKIDTEGFEAEVLVGARGWLSAGRVRAILLEASPGFCDIGFVNTIAKEHGFAVFRIGYGGTVRYRPRLQKLTPSDVEHEQSQVNYLLLRADLASDAEVKRLTRWRRLPRQVDGSKGS